MSHSRHNVRTVRAATGTELTARSWLTEAPLRMLMNNLDPDVAENPHELVVYGGIGRAARTWDASCATPSRLRHRPRLRRGQGPSPNRNPWKLKARPCAFSPPNATSAWPGRTAAARRPKSQAVEPSSPFGAIGVSIAVGRTVDALSIHVGWLCALPEKKPNC